MVRSAAARALIIVRGGSGQVGRGAIRVFGTPQEQRATENYDPRLRDDRRHWAKMLETGYAHPHCDTAVSMILPCEQSAGAALATAGGRGGRQVPA